MKTSVGWVRRAQRVIRMVGELHRKGYQGLRVMPYAYPLAWRLAIAPRGKFSAINGAVLEQGVVDVPTYSGASGGNEYFDWDDAKADSAAELSEKFLRRFERVTEFGRGRDWAYAGWLQELLGAIEGNDVLPVVQWDEQEQDPETLRYIPLWSFDENGVRSMSAGRFPLPPCAT